AALAADEQPPGGDLLPHVGAGLLPGPRAEQVAARVELDVRLVRAIETLQRQEQPGDATLQEAEPRVRVALQDAVEDDAGEVDQQAEGVAEGGHGSCYVHFGHYKPSVRYYLE